MPADELFAERLRKVEQLAARGIPSYGVDFRPTATMTRARALLEVHEREHPPEVGEPVDGPEVAVAGRVMQLRLQGRVCFAHLEDESGRLKAWFREDRIGDAQYTVVRSLDTGDIVGAIGHM